MVAEEGSLTKTTKAFSFRKLIKFVEKNDWRGLKAAFKLDGFDVNISNRTGQNALHHAAVSDKVKILETLLEHPQININATDFFSMTPLMTAAYYGKSRSVKLLLKNGAKVSCSCRDGKYASISENLECVKSILKDTTRMSSAEKKKWAKEFSYNSKIMALLRKLIIETNDPDNLRDFGSAVLLHACKQGSLETVKLIVDEGIVDINSRDCFGNTPLQAALMGSFQEIAQYLIQKGADLATQVSKGRFTFDYVAEYDDSETFLEKFEPEQMSVIIETFKSLIVFSRYKTLRTFTLKCAKKHLNNPKIFNQTLAFAFDNYKEGYMEVILSQNNDKEYIFELAKKAIVTSKFELFELLHKRLMELRLPQVQITTIRIDLFITAMENGCNVVGEYLLYKGLDPNAVEDCNSLLIRTCLAGNNYLVESLLKHGAQADWLNKHHMNALGYATERNDLEIVKTLLKYHGQVSYSRDINGFSPLLLSAFKGYRDVFFELFKVDKNLRQKTIDKTTPFLAACHSGNMEIIKALFEAGACLIDTDNQNRNCLHIAAKNQLLCEFLYTKLDFHTFYSLLIAEDIGRCRPLDTILSNNYIELISELWFAVPNLIDVIKSPIRVIIQETNQENQETCLICRDQLVKDDCAILLPCKHLYHEDCYKEWGKRNQSCPYCQRPAKRIG